MNILAIDVCGTLFSKNTTYHFITYYHLKNDNHFKYYFLKFIYNSTTPIKYILLLITKVFKHDIHRHLTLYTLKKEKKESIEEAAKHYYKKLEPYKIEKTHTFIAEKIKQGWVPVLVSNSIDVAINPIAEKNNFEYVASKLAWEDNKCLGSLAVDLTGRKRFYLEKKLGQSLSTMNFEVITDNKSDIDLIAAARSATLVAKAKPKKWMLKTNAKILLY